MDDQCYLTIIAHGYLRVSGKQAESFLKTMTTALMSNLAGIGGSVQALILSAEAEVIDRVTLIKTGDEEFMIITSPTLHEEVLAWLKAHANLADANGPVFAGIVLSDESEALTALTLFGEKCTDILQELSANTLLAAPKMGNLRMVRFDTVTAMVFSPEPYAQSQYQLFCSPVMAEGLYNALLSFPEIEIVDADRYHQLQQIDDPWAAVADQGRYYHPDSIDLMHLVRSEHDFVGGKALADRMGESNRK